MTVESHVLRRELATDFYGTSSTSDAHPILSCARLSVHVLSREANAYRARGVYQTGDKV